MDRQQRTEGQQGSGVVETALILPLLILTMFMIVELGRLFWTQHAVSSAAAEGARLAILNEPSDNEVLALVRRTIQAGGVPQAATVSVSARVPSQPVTVAAAVDFQFLVLPSWIAGLAGTHTLFSAAVMEHEP